MKFYTSIKTTRFNKSINFDINKYFILYTGIKKELKDRI